MKRTRTVSMSARGRVYGARAPLIALISFVVALIGVCVLATGAFAALPEGRVYEQVSPEFKAGYPVSSGFSEDDRLAVDGESVEFNSIGAFSGSGANYALNPYVARRTPSGWVTSGLFPSQLEGEWLGGLEQMSPDLSRFEYVGSPAVTAFERLNASADRVWLREPDGSFAGSPVRMETAGKGPITLSVVGASRDLSRLVIEHTDPPPNHILEGDVTQAEEQLFELDGSSLRLVALDGQGKQLTAYCAVKLGGGEIGFESAFGAVSQPSGSEVFFSVCGGELYVRVDGRETIKIASDATFQGASENGGRVFFTTTESLTAGDKDTSNDLYMARIGCAGGLEGEACGSEPREVLSLTQVSQDPRLGEAANVITGEGAVVVSPSGHRVYFVASGVLSGAPNGEGESAVAGAYNLYVYDVQSETVSFVADLCSGSSLSGSVTDIHCPGTGRDFYKDNPGERQPQSPFVSQTTGDGRFLVFESYGQLVRRGGEADTDTAGDVYLYDAASGVLRRVSVGEAGTDGNGNNSAFDASITKVGFHGSLQAQYELTTRAISENGSTVVFTSTEPLSLYATNGEQDVYVWHDGSVGLISSGASTEPDEKPVISPSGRDILFMTASGLLSTDIDGERDIYDARIDGGFPSAEAAREPCSGDACPGALSIPAPLLVAGSISQPAGSNVPAPVTTAHKSKSKPVKHRKPQRHKHKSKSAAASKRRVAGHKSTSGNVRGSGR